MEKVFEKAATASRSWILLGAMLLVYAGLGIGYILLVPLWESPDEPSNFSTAYALAKARRVPTPMEQPLFPGVLLNSKLHPPGSFLLTGGMMSLGPDVEPIIKANPLGMISAEIPRYVHGVGFPKDTFLGAGFLRSLRGLSLLLGAFSLMIVWRTARVLSASDSLVCFLAVALFGFTPTWIFSHAAIDPLPVAVLLSSLILYYMVLFVRTDGIDTRRWRLLAVLLFLGMATRSTLTFLFLPAAFIILKQNRSERGRLVGQLLAPVLLGLIWMLVLFPGPTYLAYKHLGALLLKFDRPFVSVAGVRTILVQTKNSFWARFGWADLYAPAQLIDVFDVASVVVVGGWMIRAWKRRFVRGAPFLLGILALGFFGYLKANMAQFDPQGRFLQLLIAAYAPLGALGFATVIKGIPWKHPRRIVVVLIPVTLVAVNVYALFGIIKPAYQVQRYTELVADAYQEEGKLVWGGTRAGQTFFSRRPGMNRVDLYITPARVPKNVTLEFCLKESPLIDDPLVTARIPYPGPNENPYVGFQFQPLWDSDGKSYYVEVRRIPDGGPIGAWYTLEDRYKGGTRYEDRRPAPGDLRFTTFCVYSRSPG